MSQKQTAWAEAKGTVGLAFDLRKVEPRAFEVSLGLDYICLISKHPDKPLWAATHNCVPDPKHDADRYEYPTPIRAVQAYRKIRAARG
jgi:hypothetical protein